MTFTHPAILLGLLAVAIPVLVHLLGRRRARRVVLPTAMFADGAKQTVHGLQWLKRAALLVLRAAAIALAVLALAGPRVGGPNPAGAAAASPEADTWLICLDTSPSMLTRDSDGTRSAVAQGTVLARLAAMSVDAQVVLVRSAQNIVQGTPGEIRAAVASVEGKSSYAWSDEPIGSLLGRGLAALRRDAGRVHALLVTDATPWAIRDLAPGQFKGLGCDVELVAVGGPVANGWLDLPRATVTESPQGRMLSVEVDAVPAEAGGQSIVHLDAGGQTRECRVGPGPGTARFLVPVRSGEPMQGKVWTAEDACPLDDARFFTGASATARVLVVDAARAETDAPRSADFVAATFAGADPVLRKDLRRLDAGRVDEAALQDRDVVFWVGAAEPPSAAAIDKFPARGGGLVWMPTDAAPPPAALARYLGGDFGQAEDVADGLTVDPGGYVSDLLSAFEGGAGGDLRRPVFKRRLALEARGGAEVVRFMDGRAAIVSRAAGAGRTVALAFGPSRIWGDLATRPEFVVLMHSLTDALTAAGGAGERNLVIGQGAAWRRLAIPRGPGNWSEEGPRGSGKGPRLFSVNLSPEETRDLSPQVDRLKAAFAGESTRLADAAQDLGRSPHGGRSDGGDAAAWFVVPLVLVVALESLVAARMSQAANRGG